MEFAAWAIHVLLLVVAAAVAIVNVELAWTIAIAVLAILVVSVGVAVVLGGGPPLATNPIAAVRTTFSLAAHVAIGLTILAATVYGIHILVLWHRRLRGTGERRPSRKQD
jgi:hypothetical protein